MPNDIIDQSEVIKDYKIGQIMTRQQVQDATVAYLGSKNPSENDAELIGAYTHKDMARIDEVAYKGEMLNKRMFISMKMFDDIMSNEFGPTWMRAQNFSQAVNNVMALPDGKDRLEQIINLNSTNPFFRLGLSTVARMGDHFRGAAEEMNGYHSLLQQDERLSAMMVESTLEPLTENRKEKLRTMATSDKEKMKQLVAENDEQQLSIAKYFMMMQLGGIKRRDEKEGDQMFAGETTMAGFIAHGGRLVVTLPTGGEKLQDHMLDSVVGENRGKASGMKKRSAATHDVRRKKVAADGTILRPARETNPKTGTWSNNYGMNFAGGGMGNYVRGTLGKQVLNDGTGGHCYVRLIPGDDIHCGQMLIGFETSEPGKANNYGLKHDWHARSAPQSSFFADKNAPGIKHDGREVDLSNLSPECFASVMNRFEQRYRELQNAGKLDDLKRINKALIGKFMSTADMKGFLVDELGFSEASAGMIATQGRFALNNNKNLANNEKYVIPEDEKVVNPAMNRVSAEERGELRGVTEQEALNTGALASKAKRDEMARQMKDLRASKVGINSGSYRKLLRAAEALQSDMELLASGNVKGSKRILLVSQIEKETEELRKLAESYVQIRSKGEPHPNFSSEWGERRFYAARSIMYLTEKIQKDLEIVRERVRPNLPQEMNAVNADNGGVRQEQGNVVQAQGNGVQVQNNEPQAHGVGIKDTNVNAIAEKLGVRNEQTLKDYSRIRNAHAPVIPAASQPGPVVNGNNVPS